MAGRKHKYRYAVVGYLPELKPGAEAQPVAVVVEDDEWVALIGTQPNGATADTDFDLGREALKRLYGSLHDQILEAIQQGVDPVDYVRANNRTSVLVSKMGRIRVSLDDIRKVAYNLYLENVEGDLEEQRDEREPDFIYQKTSARAMAVV